MVLYGLSYYTLSESDKIELPTRRPDFLFNNCIASKNDISGYRSWMNSIIILAIDYVSLKCFGLD